MRRQFLLRLSRLKPFREIPRLTVSRTGVVSVTQHFEGLRRSAAYSTIDISWSVHEIVPDHVDLPRPNYTPRAPVNRFPFSVFVDHEQCQGEKHDWDAFQPLALYLVPILVPINVGSGFCRASRKFTRTSAGHSTSGHFTARYTIQCAGSFAGRRQVGRGKRPEEGRQGQEGGKKRPALEVRPQMGFQDG